MRITTRLSFPEYRKFVFAATYKRPTVIVYSIIGFVIFVFGFLALIPGWEIFSSNVYMSFIMGLLLMGITPYFAFKTAKQHYDSNLRLQETIVYDVSDNGVIITGNSFSGEKSWDKVYKIQELKDWFMIYENNAIANLIPKSQMTTAEADELRSIFYRATIAGKKKLK